MIGRFLIAAGFALGTGVLSAGAEPIHDAARNGDVGKLQQLLETGASVEANNSSKETPLMIAALAGKHSAVRLLLKHGADAQSRNNRGMTPLHAAAFSGSLDTVSLLLEAGADINDNTNFFKISPLHAAAEENHVAVLKQLVKNGANVEAQEKHGYTALSRAGWKENWAIVDVLISAGGLCQPKEMVGDWLWTECNKRKN